MLEQILLYFVHLFADSIITICFATLVASATVTKADEIKTCNPNDSHKKLVACLNWNIKVLSEKLATKVSAAGPFLIRNRNEGQCLVIVDNTLKINKDCAKGDRQYQFDLQ